MPNTQKPVPLRDMPISDATVAVKPAVATEEAIEVKASPPADVNVQAPVIAEAGYYG